MTREEPPKIECSECKKDLTHYTGNNDTPYFGFTITTYRVPDGPGIMSYRSLGPTEAEAYRGLHYCSVDCAGLWINRKIEFHKECRRDHENWLRSKGKVA